MTQLDFINTVKDLEDSMFRLAKSILISTDEASDAVQEVIEKLWMKRKHLRNISNRNAYFMKSIRNYCLDRIKSKQSQEKRFEDISYRVQAFSGEKQYEKKEAYNLLINLINNLPEKQKTIIQLRDIEGYEFREISEILEMKENAIRTSLSRTRKLLRQKLIKEYEYGL